MRHLRKLLSYVGRTWNKEAKDVPILTLRKHNGTYDRISIVHSQLHFHSQTFRPNMPLKETIVLDDALTIQGLVDIINSMGYEAEVHEDAVILQLHELASYSLMEVQDVDIYNDQILTIFRSTTWQVLYPISRLLADADGDIDKAIEQMYAHSARGMWLDYWATFFGIRRITGEDDVTLSRRIFVTFMNLKTNNMAIQELLQFALKSPVELVDSAPAEFTLTVSMAHMDTFESSKKLIDNVRGAGISYILNYKDSWSENMPSIIADHAGTDFRSMDSLSGIGERTHEDTYTGAYSAADVYNTLVEMLDEAYPLPSEDVFSASQSDYELTESSFASPVDALDAASTSSFDATESPYPQPSEDNSAGVTDHTYTEATYPAPVDANISTSHDYTGTEAWTPPADAFNTLTIGQSEVGFMYAGVVGFELNEGELNVTDFLPASTTETLSGSATPDVYTDTFTGAADAYEASMTDAFQAETFTTPLESHTSSMDDPTLEDSYLAPSEDTSLHADMSSPMIENYGTLQEDMSYSGSYDVSETYTTPSEVLGGDMTPPPYEEMRYWVALDAFELNTSELNSSMPLVSLRTTDGGSMSMTDSQGNVVQSSAW